MFFVFLFVFVSPLLGALDLFRYVSIEPLYDWWSHYSLWWNPSWLTDSSFIVFFCISLCRSTSFNSSLSLCFLNNQLGYSDFWFRCWKYLLTINSKSTAHISFVSKKGLIWFCNFEVKRSRIAGIHTTKTWVKSLDICVFGKKGLIL